MLTQDRLAGMGAQELRDLASSLLGELTVKQLKIDQLTHEMALLKRWKFAARSEQLHGEQRHLFEEAIEADLQAIGLELEGLRSIA